MKKLLFSLVLASVAALVAFGVYTKTRPVNPRFDCEIRWLSHKLSLTPGQTAKVRALHVKFCPTMNGLKAQLKSCNAAHRTECEKSCRDSTAKLIEAVSAELDPDQQRLYRELLEARKAKAKATTGPGSN